jgi:hypothetical protein
MALTIFIQDVAFFSMTVRSMTPGHLWVYCVFYQMRHDPPSGALRRFKRTGDRPFLALSHLPKEPGHQLAGRRNKCD